MMKLFYGSPKEGEAIVEASPYGFLHWNEPISDHFHKKD